MTDVRPGSAFRIGDVATIPRWPCWRKERYDSRSDPQLIAHFERLRALGDDSLEIYEHCRHCGGVHLGHDRRKEPSVGSIQDAIADGGRVVVFIGEGYTVERQQRLPYVQVVAANQLVPDKVASILPSKIATAVLTDRIDHRVYLSISSLLKQRRTNYILRKTQEALTATLHDLTSNGAAPTASPTNGEPPPAGAQAAPEQQQPPAPTDSKERRVTAERGVIPALVDEFLPKIATMSPADAGRFLWPIAKQRNIPTTQASIEQQVRVTAKRLRAAAEATQKETATAAAQTVAPAPPPTPEPPADPPATDTAPAVTVADPDPSNLKVLADFDAAVTSLSRTRDYVAHVESRNVQLAARNTELERANGDLQAKLTLLREAWEAVR